MLSPQSIKRDSQVYLDKVLNKLTLSLGLSAMQSATLATLIKQKSDADANAPIYKQMLNGNLDSFLEDIESGNPDRLEPTQQIRDQLFDNRRRYQNEVTQLLSIEQLATYQQIEHDKGQKRFKTKLATISTRLINKIPSIEYFQKEEIKRYFKGRNASLMPIEIGIYGFANSRFFGWNSSQLAQDKQAFIEQLLTSQQFFEYKNLQKKLENDFKRDSAFK